MADQDASTRECPFCKEEVKLDAIRCKHCQAAIPAATPGHLGVCPFCKENIKPEAIRCMHCKADLATAERHTCCEGCLPVRRVSRRQTATRSQHVRAMRPTVRVRRSNSEPWGCWDCPDVVQFDDSPGDWVFTDCDDDYCYYRHDPLSYP